MKRIIILALVMLSMAQAWAKEPATRFREKLFDNKSKYVTVVAHRGDWRNSPENSIQAFKNCIEMGVDMIEIDVRKTKDNELVIIHDATVDRTTNGKGKVSDLTLEEVKKLRLRAGHGVVTRHEVPTLEEVLNLCKGKVLINIDKGYDYFQQMYSLLTKTGTLDQVVIKGGHSYDKVKAQNGKVLDEVIYMPIVNLNNKNAEELLDGWLAAKPVAIECCIGKYDAEVERLLKKIKQSDSKIWINSLWPSLNDGHDDDRAVEMDQEDEAWGWILDRGATLIQTDRPEELLDYLDDKKRRK
jgi:glycerophosphoryl diester phosphodiesterase